MWRTMENIYNLVSKGERKLIRAVGGDRSRIDALIPSYFVHAVPGIRDATEEGEETIG